ncbi:hypothetical protein O181_065819 [Austropuccinia psidii MF-1]|uniref:Uncharacterized protein n=1 Tax=Austropuccinia psidii MF-1 TaxID=1389203 RepID=A0A9Q3I4X4_9BASI|nr:hypothetical protein [Austropuccinia psidii MF-1]
MLSHPRPYHPYAQGVPSQHSPDTTDPYACVVPSQHAPNTAYHPYACRVPSRHCLASLRLQSALPTLLTILTLAERPPNTAYHPYAHRVPSRHAPNTTYPYASVIHP